MLKNTHTHTHTHTKKQTKDRKLQGIIPKHTHTHTKKNRRKIGNCKALYQKNLKHTCFRHYMKENAKNIASFTTKCLPTTMWQEFN